MNRLRRVAVAITTTSLLVFGCMVEISSPKSEPNQPPIEMGHSDSAVVDQGQVVDHGVDMADVQIANDAARVDVDMLPENDMSSADALVTDAEPSTEPFFDPAWQRRVRLTLSTDTITEIVEDVAIFVRIPRELDNAEMRLETHQQLRFVDESGSVLPHRVNFSNDQEMHAWVRLARFDPSTAQSLWLYYDNPQAAESASRYNPEAPASGARLWTETDFSVLHMDPESQGFRLTFKDSSGSNNSGRLTAGRVAGRPNEGEFGDIFVNAQPFNSSLEISGPDDGSVAFEALTVNLSYRDPQPIDNEGYLFGDPDYTGVQLLLQLRRSSIIRVVQKVPLPFFGVGSTVIAEVPVELGEPDAYLHVSFTYGPEQRFLMVNGAFHDVSATAEASPNQGFLPWNQPLRFGAGLEMGIDEIHVMSASRSEDWVRLRQRSLLGSLVTFGESEVRPDASE